MGTISATDLIVLDNTNPDIVKGFYKWPFNITRVFYTRTEGNRVSEPDCLLSGLMSRAHLSGFVYELMEKLASAGVMATATLIQKESPDTEDDTSYRINMDLLDGGRYRCKSECPAEKCREFEKDIAELFLSRERNECDKGKLKDEIISVCKKFKNKCNECQEKTDACNFDSCNCGLEAGADPMKTE